jgi:hypothetical protein
MSRAFVADPLVCKLYHERFKLEVKEGCEVDGNSWYNFMNMKTM